MGLQSFLELCAKNAIRPTSANRSKNPLTSPSKYKGGYGGGDRIFVPLWQVHSLLELSERRAILPGTLCAVRDTSWIFARLAQYDRPPAPRSLTVARKIGAPDGRSYFAPNCVAHSLLRPPIVGTPQRLALLVGTTARRL